MTLSPKSQFLSNAEDAKAFALLVHNAVMHHAMTCALADMIMDGHTKEELMGAKAFAVKLLNLAEPPGKVAVYPEKKLIEPQPDKKQESTPPAKK